jgi:predicted RNA binding protein YcfA (HicA-like mRNA interferase family)
MPSVKPKDLVRIMKKLGWIEQRQEGSHKILINKELKKAIPVPMHSRDLKKGTLAGILKRAEISNEEFKELI